MLWAQRSSTTDPARNIVYVAISAPDVPKDKLKLDLQPTKIVFSGYSESKKVDYAVELELYAEVDPNESKINHTGKNIEMVLRKAELAAEYWPRLLKESKRLHFVKTDFDKVRWTSPNIFEAMLTTFLNSGSTRTSKTRTSRTTT